MTAIRIALWLVVCCIAVAWGGRYLGRFLPGKTPVSAPPASNPDELRVCVWDSNGSAFAEASIAVECAGSGLEAPRTTDTSGSMVFSRAQLDASHAIRFHCSYGPLKAIAAVPPRSEAFIFVRLPVSFTASGQVRSRATRAPLPGVQVFSGPRSVTTDFNGEFAIAVVPQRQSVDGSVTLETRFPSGGSKSTHMPWSKAVEYIVLERDD